MPLSSRTKRLLAFTVVLSVMSPLASLYVIWTRGGADDDDLFTKVFDARECFLDRCDEERPFPGGSHVGSDVQAVTAGIQENNKNGVRTEWKRRAWSTVISIRHREILDPYVQRLIEKHITEHDHEVDPALIKDIRNELDTLLLKCHYAKSLQVFTLAVPWLVALTLGLIVPLCVRLYGLWVHGKWRWSGKSATQELRRSLGPFTMQLKGGDAVDGPPRNGPRAAGPRDWRVPRPGATLKKHHEMKKRSVTSWRNVPGECAICLRDWDVGERVSWSSNGACVHCFHSDCIVEWLAYRTRAGQQCPCCRQPFLPSKRM
jgi:hypothetical protein